MKKFILFSYLFTLFSPQIIGQTVCDQFKTNVKKINPQKFQKRSLKITSYIENNNNINVVERDTFGRVHFLGNIGSLKIEAFYAYGKRYSKIQSDFIKDDEWTWREATTEEMKLDEWWDSFKNQIQNADCQVVGEEKIQLKKCTIFAYTLHKFVPKRPGTDSVLMDISVQTWFCFNDNLPYKHTYQMTAEKDNQIVSTTVEYNAFVKIDIPKKAQYEGTKKNTDFVSQTVDNNKIYEKLDIKPSDDNILIEKSKISLSETPKTDDSTTIFATVDQLPEYKNGVSELYKFISNNMNISEEARKQGLSGAVHVSFIVEIDGSLSNIVIKRSIHNDIDKEAIRLVKSMSGAWKAGKIKGKEVRSNFVLPLRFELRE